MTWALPWLYWPTFEELNRMGTVQRGYLLGVELNHVSGKEAGISQTWWKTYVTSRAFHLVCLGKNLRMGSFTNLTRRFSWAVTLGQHCFIPLACCHGLLLPMLMNHTSWFWRLKLPRNPWFSGAYEEVKNNRIKSCARGVKGYWHGKRRTMVLKNLLFSWHKWFLRWTAGQTSLEYLVVKFDLRIGEGGGGG